MTETLKLLGLRALASPAKGVTRRAAADAKKLLEANAAARAARAQREKTVEHFVAGEFREAKGKRRRDSRFRGEGR